MKITKFKDLWKAVEGYSIHGIDKTVIEEIALFEEEGVETDFTDIFESFDDSLITVFKDGTVRKTILYISEIYNWYLEKYSYPKYHISSCQTINSMFSQGKKYRYKKTTRYDGKFLMVITDNDIRKEEKKDIKLEVCGNCLKKFNNKNDTQFYKKNFSIEEYIKRSLNKEDFNPVHYITIDEDFTTVPRFYAKNWNEISKKLKEQNNYTCQECKINLQKNKQYLHTHHVDSNPSNNIISNLKVLCIECHANQHNHSHMKTANKYKDFINTRDKLGV